MVRQTEDTSEFLSIGTTDILAKFFFVVGTVLVIRCLAAPLASGHCIC